MFVQKLTICSMPISRFNMACHERMLLSGSQWHTHAQNTAITWDSVEAIWERFTPLQNRGKPYPWSLETIPPENSSLTSQTPSQHSRTITNSQTTHPLSETLEDGILGVEFLGSTSPRFQSPCQLDLLWPTLLSDGSQGRDGLCDTKVSSQLLFSRVTDVTAFIESCFKELGSGGLDFLPKPTPTTHPPAVKAPMPGAHLYYSHGEDLLDRQN